MSHSKIERFRIERVEPLSAAGDSITVWIQKIGSHRLIAKPLSELFKESWFYCFSKEDRAHISALKALEQNKAIDRINSLPEKIERVPASIMVVAMLFIAFSLLSNLTAVKVIQIGNLIYSAGIVFFPMTYVFDNILTEVYGFETSRRVIWLGMAANIIVVIGTSLTVFLKPAPFWHEQAAYSTIFLSAPKIVLASTCAYFFGEFSNSILLAKLKVIMRGKHMWSRFVLSTVVGVGIDTIVFCSIAFAGQLTGAQMFKIMWMMYLAKVFYEILALPVTYKITNYLKRRDHKDAYDVDTDFNPFSLKVGRI